MSLRQPRTEPPSVPFDGRITRFIGRRDSGGGDPWPDLSDCPECGSESRDLWADEGVVTLRFRCPDCSSTWEPEVSR